MVENAGLTPARYSVLSRLAFLRLLPITGFAVLRPIARPGVHGVTLSISKRAGGRCKVSDSQPGLTTSPPPTLNCHGERPDYRSESSKFSFEPVDAGGCECFSVSGAKYSAVLRFAGGMIVSASAFRSHCGARGSSTW